MFKTEKWAISNKMTTCPWSKNPHPISAMKLNGSVSVVANMQCSSAGCPLKDMDLLCPMSEAGPAPGASPTAPVTQPQKSPVPHFLQYSQVTSPSA